MKKTFNVLDAVSLIVGIVVGAGIFRASPLVALHTGSESLFLLAWFIGGVISLAGALCYAELATAFPHHGGDYHYLTLAFGRPVGFLFVWARMTVIQTGSIAMLGFVLGDYLSHLIPLGPRSSAIYAALSVSFLTVINILGLKQGKRTQHILTGTKVLGLVLVVVGGLFFSSPAPGDAGPAPTFTPLIGLTLVFVLLTFGGWNEAVYISAEMRETRRDMITSLAIGIGVITALYLLVNLAYVRTLGINGLAKSEAVAYDLMRRVTGPGGAAFMSLLIAISALGAMNGTIITGARTNYAMGREFSLFRLIGRWHEGRAAPVNAYVVQGIISLLLVLVGSLTMEGFVAMVEYTAPVFWLFFFLAVQSLIILRLKQSEVDRPFRVPLYPFTPLLFLSACVFMFVSSIEYAGFRAAAGILVLLAGVPFVLISGSRKPREG